FAVAICFSNSQSLLSQVNIQDSLALVDLYNNTDGPHWNANENWLTINPVSTWQGIYVNPASNRVREIRLSFLNLNGTIPFSIGNISNLYWLDLQGNQLTGDIPSSIGRLKNLHTLGLAYNQLGGIIPASLRKLKNLKVLWLQRN